jgi:palmitoyltransferase ZDHHC9/14/18
MWSATRAQKTLYPVPQSSPIKYRLPTRSTRTKVATYDVTVLVGTAIHTPKKYLNKPHKNGTGGPVGGVAQRDGSSHWTEKTCEAGVGKASFADQAEEQLLAEAAHAAHRQTLSPAVDFHTER